MTQPSTRPSWLKTRGYLHITPKIDVYRQQEEILSKVKNKDFVAKHAFFPLIHSVIKERKYKTIPGSTDRAHSYKADNGYKKNEKLRPLHYSTHIDSMIFGYYAEMLLGLYETELNSYEALAECVTAYRKVGIGDGVENKGKSTIHFANEAFSEIQQRSQEDDCVVLMFDIKSFFSEIDHNKLHQTWCELLKVKRLDKDHFNVYKAATKFSYILKDELRLPSNHHTKRNGFDEKKLAFIRRTKGFEAFYESIEEFRNAVNKREIKVYKHPFTKNKIPVGIPQGLPISAVLANLYLFPFDLEVLKEIVYKYKGYYRRYSDDILIICKLDQYREIEKFVLKAILERNVEISSNKTEIFLFRKFNFSPNVQRLTPIQIIKNKHGDEILYRIGEKPLTYLGFEFHGNKIQIKSGNLSKFYRRMIYATKRKANRAF